MRLQNWPIRAKNYAQDYIAYKWYNNKCKPNRKPIIAFNIRKPHLYHRYLYTFIKFLHLEGFQVIFPGSLYQFRKIINADIYLNLLLKEKIIQFRSTTKEQVFLELNDNNLSPDYYSFLHQNRSENDFYVPMTFHPLFYHKDLWNLDAIPIAKKKSIFMAGNFDEHTYSAIEKTFFNIKSRTEIYNFLKEKEILTLFETNQEFKVFVESEIDYKCVILTTDKVSIPMDKLLETLSSFKFFLACPGVIIPNSHNIIEAISVGCIPLIQYVYAETFHPPLEHLKTGIIFNDFEDLQNKVQFCYDLPDDKIKEMQKNIMNYYGEYLTPKAVVGKIKLNKDQKIYLQAEFESAKLFRYAMLSKLKKN